MKCKHLFSLLTAAVLCLSQLMLFPVSAEESVLVDSGSDYTEAVETIANPGAGYTSTLWYYAGPGTTSVKSPSGNLVLMFIDLGPFSSGVNGTTDEEGNYIEGTDYDLDDNFFTAVRGTFENCRRNGSTIALRFRYDSNGKTNPEPASFDQVLRHIQQIKDNGLLEDYQDILMFVETGFVGAWGEQWGGKYTSLEYKAQLVDAMLDCVPGDIPITVRTPNIFAQWAGISVAEMADYIAEPGSDAARIGMYNDGYMGSDTDLGTYTNRSATTDWMHHQMLHTYYGGEFSGDLNWTQKYDTYLPENAIPEMYKTHLSYINSNIYALYKDYTFGAAYDVDGVDNSAYYGQTVFQFMRDHLGYRFVVRKAEHTNVVKQGENLQLNFSVENTGFANPIRPQKAELLLEKDGDFIQTEVDIDTRTWLSCTTTDTQLSVKLPGDIAPGNWKIYLRMSVGNQGIEDDNQRTVHFANNHVWNDSLGANYMGTVTIGENDDIDALTDHTFYQTNTEDPVISNGDIYTKSGMIVLDGQRSSDSEWTEDLLLAEEDGNKLYVTNDNEYFYVMAEIDQNAVSPVYNLRLKNSTNGETYWLYYQPNGFIYFNHGAYDGCIYKHVGNCVEFRVPFGNVMGLEPGVELEFVRVFIQDMSITGWPSAGAVQSGMYTVTDTFNVYSVERFLQMKEHDDFICHAETAVENASYVWLFNDEEIPGANGASYTIQDASADSVGTYSVRITSPSGTQLTVPICTLTDVFALEEPQPVVMLGDCNADNIVTLADLVLMQKYLLHEATLTQDGFLRGDMNDDHKLNGFDLTMLRVCLSTEE